MRIAMWSGPRNLSTAMMYSFAARGDCAIWDEPFYGAFLKITGLDHPMRDVVLREVETDPEGVVEAALGPIPAQKAHFYQKHMTHHMVTAVPRNWMAEVKNVFLIRHPARVIASYLAKREHPTGDDIGFWQQAEIFDEVRARTGGVPVVIDASDIRQDPAGMLSALCDRLGLPFTEAMLRWPAGGRPEDGPWAPHWYGSVWTSTGFAGPEGPLPDVAAENALLREAMVHYERLADHRLCL
ncbi:MAG: HAD family hydrolase [Pseudomonadota bacterium]